MTSSKSSSKPQESSKAKSSPARAAQKPTKSKKTTAAQKEVKTPNAAETAPADKPESLEKATVTPETVPAPEKPAPDAAVTVVKRGGFAGVLVGGAIAAAAGFGVSQYLGNDNWPFSDAPTETEQLAKIVEAQNARIVELEKSLAQITSTLTNVPTVTDLDEIGQMVAQNNASIADLEQTIAAFDQRVVDLENRPITPSGAPDEAVAAYERELHAMRQMFQAELDRIEARQAEALKSQEKTLVQARAAAALASVAKLQSALDSGEPFEDVLAELAGSGASIPAGLSAQAAGGVPTLFALRESFPEFARAALAATSRDAAPAGGAGGITAFLRAQLGARSLEPRDGDDPDAILSRAEAALGQGDLAGAMQEIDHLPETAKREMTPWITSARSRQQAVEALGALTAQLSR